MKARIYATLACFSIANFSTITVADESYRDHSETPGFVEEMVTEYNFDRKQVTAWLAAAERKQSILDAMSRPAERTKTWAEYRKIFVVPKRIDLGVKFWQENKSILERAEKEFGVPAEIIVAIIGVETYYGGNMGSFRVIDALTTLGFDYPKRSKFFRRELKEFLLLAREQNKDPLSLKGSYAGAMGYGQFIPSSYRAYAIDYDKDSFADIWSNTEDAIGSVANYFKKHGWKANELVAVRARVAKNYDRNSVNQSLNPKLTVAQLEKKGFIPSKKIQQDQLATAVHLDGDWGSEYWLGLNNFYVITRYNRSRLYAMAVWELSQEIAKAKAAVSS